MKYVFALILFITSGLNATDVTKCSDAEIEFIRQTVHSKGFLEKETNRQYKVKPEQYCSLSNDLVSDGLGFGLYRFENSIRYIQVYNGFDGTVKMYGPFVY